MAILTNHQTNTLGSNVDTDLATFTDGTLSVAGTLDVTNFKVGGAQGTDGQVLTSTGSGVAWEAAGGGGTGNINFSANEITTADADMVFKIDTDGSSTGYESYYFYGGPTSNGYVRCWIQGTSETTLQLASGSYKSAFIQKPTYLKFLMNENGANAPVQFQNYGNGSNAHIDLGVRHANARVRVTDHVGNLYYSLPRSVPSSGNVLTASDGSGTLDWSAPSGGGDANQNAFSNVSVAGQTNVVADSATDTLTLVAGSNITLTTDASTDTVTITSSGSPSGSNPNGFPFSRMASKNASGSSSSPASFFYPSDLSSHTNFSKRYSTGRSYYVPWVAPMSGALATIGVNVRTNSTLSGDNLYYGIYSSAPAVNSSSHTAGTPYQRLGFCTFSIYGAGTGNKRSTVTSDGTASGNAVSVVQGELYYLALGLDLSSYNNIWINAYRKNGFMGFTEHAMQGSSDYSFYRNGLPSAVTSVANQLYINSEYPPSMYASYA